MRCVTDCQPLKHEPTGQTGRGLNVLNAYTKCLWLLFQHTVILPKASASHLHLAITEVDCLQVLWYLPANFLFPFSILLPVTTGYSVFKTVVLSDPAIGLPVKREDYKSMRHLHNLKIPLHVTHASKGKQYLCIRESWEISPWPVDQSYFISVVRSLYYMAPGGEASTPSQLYSV